MTPFDAPPQYLMEETVKVTRPRPAGSETSGSPGPQVFTIRLEERAADWLRPAIDRISNLTALARSWDSYGAPPVEADCALHAVQFLLSTAYSSVPPPTIVPLTDGGIQLEWHRGGIDFEIAFSDLEPGVYVADRDAGEEVELPLREAATELARFAARLAAA